MKNIYSTDRWKGKKLYTLDRNLPITDGSVSYTFTNIQSSHTITSNWIAQYYLNVTSDYGDPLGGGWYDANSMATFSVTSPVGTFIQQVFVGWSGDSMATTPSGSINMNGPKTVVANWRADYTQLSITAAAIAGGSIGALALTKRLPIRKPTKPTPKPPPLPVERIVDTGFSSQAGAAVVLDPFLPLALAQYYYFWFEVGPLVPESIELKPDPLIVKWYTPSDTRLKVVLFAFDGEIEIKSGGDTGEIHIMPDGQAKVVRRVEHPDNIPVGSDLLNRRLFFLVHTPNKEGTFRLRCNIYYEQILVQSRLIQARVSSSHVRSNVPALQSAIEYALSKTLNPNYLARMIPHKLSVMLNDNSEGTHCFRLYGEKDYKGNTCFDAQDLETLVRDIRGALRRASWGDEEPWTEGKNYHYEGGYNEDKLKEDLINFAIRGYRFWSRLNEKIAGPLPEVKELEKLILKPAFLGFQTNPLGLVYNIYAIACLRLEKAPPESYQSLQTPTPPIASIWHRT